MRISLNVKSFAVNGHQVVLHDGERGMSGSEIAAELNGRELSRRNGQPWTQRQVAAVIGRRLLYAKGAVRYGDVEGVNENLILMIEGEKQCAVRPAQ